MQDFHLPAMSCGHCEASVRKALSDLDAQAQIEVDLSAKQVHVATALPREALAQALSAAGYPPA